MNSYKYAMNMEIEGEKFYRDLSQKTSDSGLKNILNMLADEEVKHYKLFETLSKNNHDIELADSNILHSAKNIFKEMKEKHIKFESSMPQTDLYKFAQDIEKKSYEFYMDKYNSTDNASQKKIFFKLAEEEKKHMILMENIVEFVSRPETWIENAEFNHLDEY